MIRRPKPDQIAHDIASWSRPVACVVVLLVALLPPMRAEAAYPRPVVSWLSTRGTAVSVAGGVRIAVHGSGFIHVSSVEFGAARGSHVVLVDSGTLTVVVPAHAPGVADVRVVASGGVSFANSGDRLTFAQPANPITQAAARPAAQGATVSLSWTSAAMPGRQLILRRTAGSTPPASATDGQLVATIAPGDTTGTFTDDQGLQAGGRYSYSWFFQAPDGAWSAPVSVTTTASGAVGGWPSIHWDTFNRGDGPLLGQISPSGLGYHIGGPAPPYVESDRMVQQPTYVQQQGTPDYSVLLMPFSTRQSTVAARFRFGIGSTAGEVAVIGSSTGGLAGGSVQLWVMQSEWRVLTVTLNGSGGIAYNLLASGTFSTPLAVDATLTASITKGPPSSTVSIDLPTGTVISLTARDPRIGLEANWGTYPFVQIIKRRPTDGAVDFTGFGAD